MRIAWGKVVVWEPPSRLVMTWHPGMEADIAQEVEVRFSAAESGTRVDLEHRGWERLGAQAPQARSGYNNGWVEVFEHLFADACGQ